MIQVEKRDRSSAADNLAGAQVHERREPTIMADLHGPVDHGKE